MAKSPPRKPRGKSPKRNPVAQGLAEPRYRPRPERPKKGKGSFVRRPAKAEEEA